MCYVQSALLGVDDEGLKYEGLIGVMVSVTVKN